MAVVRARACYWAGVRAACHWVWVSELQGAAPEAGLRWAAVQAQDCCWVGLWAGLRQEQVLWCQRLAVVHCCWAAMRAGHCLERVENPEQRAAVDLELVSPLCWCWAGGRADSQ